uniref:C-type lectin domain-containing protein n=1 Tax=Hucho hucho TaxID=62062 RepID=A0A4W5LQS3_9TELE
MSLSRNRQALFSAFLCCFLTVSGAENTGPGRRVYRLVAVSFGLLCVAQVIVNVSLHLFFYSKIRKITPTTCYFSTALLCCSSTGMLTQGWRFFGSSWYYISTETKSWEESRKDCKGRGADLVIINSKEEQEFIHGFQKMRYWIGLSDIEMESTMTWVDGTPLTIKFWMIGEPNNMNGTEDCIELMHPSTFNNPLQSWNDETCSNSFFWICETVACL